MLFSSLVCIFFNLLKFCGEWLCLREVKHIEKLFEMLLMKKNLKGVFITQQFFQVNCFKIKVQQKLQHTYISAANRFTINH